jgi:hypothetical protein
MCAVLKNAFILDVSYISEFGDEGKTTITKTTTTMG